MGEVLPEELGFTLPHEHLLVDLCAWNLEPEDDDKKALVTVPVEIRNLGAIRRDPLVNRDNCVLDDQRLAIEELRKFKEAGGGSVVDCTNIGMGRQPIALREIPHITGVNVVMGSGYYIGRVHVQAFAHSA